MKKIILVCLSLLMTAVMFGCSKNYNSAIVGKWTCQDAVLQGEGFDSVPVAQGEIYEFTTDGTWYKTDCQGVQTKGIFSINDTMLVVGSEGTGICYTIKELKNRKMSLAWKNYLVKWKK